MAGFYGEHLLCERDGGRHVVGVPAMATRSAAGAGDAIERDGGILYLTREGMRVQLACNEPSEILLDRRMAEAGLTG
jgi:hypothetical protein